jgi:hypothetical protein
MPIEALMPTMSGLRTSEGLLPAARAARIAGAYAILICYCSAAEGGEPSSRSVLQWPFAATSIWNMPIGSNAVFVPAKLDGLPGGEGKAPMPQADVERIVLRPDAPLAKVFFSDAAWSNKKDRCKPTGELLQEVPMPADYVVRHSMANNSAVFLARDGRTLLQMQPFTRCAKAGPATSLVKFSSVDIYGSGQQGSHGGSGLSALGGSLRVGELRPGLAPPRHALKINVYARQFLHNCKVRADCYRWPATNADDYAVGHYGSEGPTPPEAMKMGALLAIPPSRPISTLLLQTEPAKLLAWTLQNYGAYIVDDTYGPAFALNVEEGPDGDFLSQFAADWGFPFEQRVRDNTPWVRDLQRILRSLHVIDNNSAAAIGGGGAPGQPLAPPFRHGPGRKNGE